MFLAKVLCLIVVTIDFSQAEQSQEEYIPLEEYIYSQTLDHFPDKDGEDIPAHKLGNWRMYVPNSLTYKELKTRPFWVHTLYHGGWYHDSGYQPHKGGFHLVNDFGVWEHESQKDHLIFKFIWPFHIKSEYNLAHDCYLGSLGSNRLLYFTLGSNFQPQNIRTYKTPFNKYLFTDKDKILWFDDGGCILIQDNQVFMRAQTTNQIPDLTFKQLQQNAESIYRKGGDSLQIYESYIWNGCRFPSIVGYNVKSFDQLDNNILFSTNKGTFEWYTKYGIYFLLTMDSSRWSRYDREGRKWLSTNARLFCLDDIETKKTTYEEFVALLPQILDEDQIVATNSMKSLLNAGEFFEGWIAENKNHEDEKVRKAVLQLLQCIDGQEALIFTGDDIIFKQLLDGKGVVPEPLPIPKKNIENREAFVETDPLILDRKKAGTLNNAHLEELPILDHIGFSFQNVGNVLVSRNTIVKTYFEVSHDQENFILTQKEAPGPIYGIYKSGNPDEVLAVIQSSEDEKILLTGKMNIHSSSFQALGNIQWANYFGAKLVIDYRDRELFITKKGGLVLYQNEPKGDFISSEMSNPMKPRDGGIVTSYKENKIIVYRSFYEKQWEGKHSKIFEFKNGKLLPLDIKKPGYINGYIYNMALISDDYLLVATQEPKKVFFMNSQTGKYVDPIFDVSDQENPKYFLISGIYDNKGRYWFHTICYADKDKGLNKIQMWDGERLSTIVECIIEKRPTLNYYTGNMCITGNGLIWIGFNEKLLIIDSNTFDYRFFRVFDRLDIPEIFALDSNWISANYGDNTTIFHLKFE